ncbi:MAG: hypothetical protein Q7S58_17710 [Candidatus Binatus sp.]|uniref:hypothetical protein n=1 Tax=Candidatus Binatus sp. TaxID=2811406 RepID=UPI002720F359|nr:hypothetical protein [Candidatus Binatus sp.]MDO8434240.1 hypothetical protein [Candidatus Binatus sp.]
MSILHTILFAATLIFALSVYVADDQSPGLQRSSSDACLLVAGVFCAILGSFT